MDIAIDKDERRQPLRFAISTEWSRNPPDDREELDDLKGSNLQKSKNNNPRGTNADQDRKTRTIVTGEEAEFETAVAAPSPSPTRLLPVKEF